MVISRGKDVSRHFISADSVKRYIDILALHNINKFHWHLTDDQGWRLEIKKHPKLTEVGSKRSKTVIGSQRLTPGHRLAYGLAERLHTSESSGRSHPVDLYHTVCDCQGISLGILPGQVGAEHNGIGPRHLGGDLFYTQEQVRDIVRYAADRQITIIPEIDLPGHMQGVLAAYPHLGCTGGPYEVWSTWGVSDEVLCVGNDATFELIDDVLTVFGGDTSAYGKRLAVGVLSLIIVEIERPA